MTPFTDPAVSRWLRRRTLAMTDHDPATLARLKNDRDLTVGVCLPALNEAATVGGICAAIVPLRDTGVVDDLVVVDSGSSDATLDVARAAGARVYRAADLVPEVQLPPRPGKGDSLWKSLAAIDTDVVVWVDSDTRNFTSRFITSLVAPLLADDGVVLTKAFYDRPLEVSEGALTTGGARVTEIAIRPLLNLLRPDLAGFIQPLSGEYGGFRELLVDLPFGTGYEVDILLLMDVVDRHGLDAVAQVDLGSRIHRNRDVRDLGRMSFEIVRALLERLDEDGRVKLVDELPERIVQFAHGTDGAVTDAFEAATLLRPPMRTLSSG